VSVAVLAFAAEHVPPVVLMRRSIKPFYAAIDKLHRPTVYVRKFAVCCLVYARSLILIFGTFTVGFCYLHQPSSTSSVYPIMSRRIVWLHRTFPANTGIHHLTTDSVDISS